MKNTKHEKVPPCVYSKFTCQVKKISAIICVLETHYPKKVGFTLQDDLNIGNFLKTSIFFWLLLRYCSEKYKTQKKLPCVI